MKHLSKVVNVKVNQKNTITITLLVFSLAILIASCEMIEVNVVGDAGTTKRLKNCDGIKLDLVIQQDAAGARIYHGTIQHGVLKFSIGGGNIFDFEKEVTMKFIVVEGVQDKSCQFTKNSTYEAKNIKLRPVWSRSDQYEVELNKFQKIY